MLLLSWAGALGYSLHVDGLFDKPKSHHGMSHNQTEDIEDSQVDQFHMEQFAYLAEKMDSIRRLMAGRCWTTPCSPMVRDR